MASVSTVYSKKIIIKCIFRVSNIHSSSSAASFYKILIGKKVPPHYLCKDVLGPCLQCALETLE